MFSGLWLVRKSCRPCGNPSAVVSAGAIVGSAWCDLGLRKILSAAIVWRYSVAAAYGTQEPFMPPLLPLARWIQRYSGPAGDYRREQSGWTRLEPSPGPASETLPGSSIPWSTQTGVRPFRGGERAHRGVAPNAPASDPRPPRSRDERPCGICRRSPSLASASSAQVPESSRTFELGSSDGSCRRTIFARWHGLTDFSLAEPNTNTRAAVLIHGPYNSRCPRLRNSRTSWALGNEK